jgi:RNA polymerase sigma-70 factor (ECF subfamily)
MRSRLKEKFLLFRIRVKKDPDAFGEIYDSYVKQIYRFIYFKVPSAEQAEDLTSEAFLKAWHYLKEKRDVTNLQALLYSVARSVVIDWYRAAAAERGNVMLEESVTIEAADAASEKLQHEIEVKFDTSLVLEKLRGLKDEYREVVILKYLDELTTGEIAAVLGKTPANVRVLVHRATKALTDAIGNEPKEPQGHLLGHQE